MSFLFCVFAFINFLVRVSSAQQSGASQTLFANASSTQPTGTLTTAPGLGSSHTTVCSGCTYELLASILTWLSLDVTTLTATSIFIVDNTTNSTSISVFTDNAILKGTSISLYTPLPTNADGVPVTTVTLLNNQLEPSITVVPYPIVLVDYDASVQVLGPFLTTLANGSASCATADGPVALPSHPPITTHVRAPEAAPTVIALWSTIAKNLGTLFPDFGPIEECSLAFGGGPGPAASFLTAVSFLTETTTSFVVPSPRDLHVNTAAQTQTSEQPTEPQPTQVNPPGAMPTAGSVQPSGDSFPSASQPGGSVAPVPNDQGAPSPNNQGAPSPSNQGASSPNNQDAPSPVDTGIAPGPVVIPISQVAPTIPVATFTIGPNPVTAVAVGSTVVIGSQTLVPGSPITFSGTHVSSAESDPFVVIGTSTISLAVPAPNSPPLTTTFSIAGSAVTAVSDGSSILIAGQTLVPGGPPITLSGTPVSLAPAASYLVFGPSTVPLPSDPPALVLTLGSNTYTANSLSQFLVAGQTLAPGGPAITVSGTQVSLAPGATAAVEEPSSDSKTDSQATLATTTSSGSIFSSVSNAAMVGSSIPTTASTSPKVGGAGLMRVADVAHVAVLSVVAVIFLM